MTVSKSIITTSAMAFALMFGGGVYVLTQLNTLAKPVVEKIATQALGVRVSISVMDISLKEKRVDVGGIRIANPDGFSKPYALTVGNVQVGLRSVSEGLIDFENIDVRGADVFLEVKTDTTNLHTLKSGMKGAQDAPSDKEPVKVIVRRFTLEEAQVNPSVTLLAEQDLNSVKVAPVRLNGIGVKENGILAREAVTQIMAPLLETFSQAAGDAGLYQGMSPDALREMGVGQVEILKDQILKEVDDIGAGIKKLFD